MISKLAPAITALSMIQFSSMLDLSLPDASTPAGSYLLSYQPSWMQILTSQQSFTGELTISEGIEHQFTIEEMDDETYTGLLIYK